MNNWFINIIKYWIYLYNAINNNKIFNDFKTYIYYINYKIINKNYIICNNILIYKNVFGVFDS